MKYIAPIFIIILFFNLALSQNKKETKTLRFSGYELKYPRTWQKKNFYGYTLLNRIVNGESLRRDVQVTVFPNQLKQVYNRNNIKDYLIKHANILFPHELKKTFHISPAESGTNFICKIEYELSLDTPENKYKKIEYIRLENSNLKFFSYMAKSDLFDKYYHEAILIINSIEKR